MSIHHTPRSIRTVVKTGPIGTVRMNAAQALSDLAGLKGHAQRVQNIDLPDGQRLDYCCGACGAPVALRFRRNARTGEQTHFFVHASRAAARDCSWYSGPGLDSLGAAQFGGQREGADHRRAKEQLIRCLQADEWFKDIALEKTILGGTEPNRRADVFAQFGAQPVVFELQLARPSLVDIVGREAFYRNRNIDLVWVTTLTALPKLTSAAFTDLVVANGGSLLAVSEECVATSQVAAELKLHQFRIAPKRGDRGSYCVWEHDMVGLDDILISAVERREKYAAAFGLSWLEQIGSGPAKAAGSLRMRTEKGASFKEMAGDYRQIFQDCRSPVLLEAHDNGLHVMLNWLSALDACLAHPDHAAAATVLATRTEALLDHNTGTGWLRRVCDLLDRHPRAATALPDPLKARLQAAASQTKHRVDFAYARLLAAVFPGLAFDLIAHAPRFPPKTGTRA